MKIHRLPTTIALGFWLLGGAALASAASLSGTYADKGAMLSREADTSADTVSLHALFALEFRPEVGVLNHDRTATVEITDEDGWFEFKTFTADGTEISRSRWGPQNGFSHEDGAAVVRISKNPDEFFSFMLTSVADGGALEVKVYQVTPSAFGPGAQPVGTYFFVKSE